MEEARSLAVKDAHSNAKTFASAVDLHVVRILSISDQSSSGGDRAYSAAPEGMMMMAKSADASDGGNAPKTDPGVLTFRAHVTMRVEAK